MACGWVLISLAGPASAQGRTPAAPPDVRESDCAMAAPVVAGRIPGPMRDQMEAMFAADGCVARLAAAEGLTPLQGPLGHGCGARADALAGGVDDPLLRAALHRRACVEGAGPRERSGAGTRTP